MKIRNNIALSETGFLFNPATGDSYSVNEIGRRIITLFKDEKSDEEVITKISNEYTVEKGSFEKDLYDFKNMLKSYKLAD